MTSVTIVGEWQGGGKKTKKAIRRLCRYREVYSDINGHYLEFEVKDRIAKCDLEFEYLLLRHYWVAGSLGYLGTRKTVDGVSKVDLFHKLVLKCNEQITHINKDKLDCRKSNLRILKQTIRPELDHVVSKVDINTAVIVKSGDWMGGNPMGSVNKTVYGYVVRFSSPTLQKNFPLTSYDDSDVLTKRAAEKFCFEEADRRGLVRNKFRMVELEDCSICLEVQLDKEKTFLCDLEDIEIVRKEVWHAHPNEGEHYYVRHSERKDRKSEAFHKLVVNYPIVDHINGNTLDNRKINLRNGSDGVNARNATKRSDNKSGVTGVVYTKNAWFVQWPEGGQRKSKRFGDSYGTYEEAKAAAIEFRLEKNRELNLHPRQE